MAKAKRRKRTPEEREQLVAKMRELMGGGMTLADASARLGINGAQFYRWQQGGKARRGAKRIAEAPVPVVGKKNGVVIILENPSDNDIISAMGALMRLREAVA